MIYTNLILFGLGVLGIFLHNLVKLDELNKAQNGKLSLRSYFRLERFSILISAVVVIISIFIKTEIKELQIAGTYLGLSFVTIGYMGQSLIVKLMGKAQKKIDG
jgi:hypothetical protein